MLFVQAQTSKAIIQNQLKKGCKKSCFEDWKLLTKRPWNFPNLFTAISSSFAYKEMMHKLRNLKI